MATTALYRPDRLFHPDPPDPPLSEAGGGGGSDGSVQLVEYDAGLGTPTAQGLTPDDQDLPAKAYAKAGDAPDFGWNTTTKAWT